MFKEYVSECPLKVSLKCNPVTQPKICLKLLSVSKVINIISLQGLNIIFDEYV